MTIALIGAMFPDLDLFYFYLIDNKQHNHHSYWIHYPIVWVAPLILAVLFLFLKKESRLALYSFVFFLGGCLHLFLDAFVGDIMFFAPFSYKYYTIFQVNIKPVLQPWWLNFILHWSFLLELLITVFAVILLVLNLKKKKASCK